MAMSAPTDLRGQVVSRDIIVVGASAGGVEALQGLVAGLPADLPAAIFVVVHWPTGAVSVLPQILRRAGRLPAEHARHGEPILHGVITVAPPDRHLLLRPGSVELAREPSEHGRRPAIDPLFRSASMAYGPRVAGVVLSGTLDDGTEGIAAIAKRGGLAIVQDPAEALFPSMPRSAIESVRVDHCLPVAGIATLLDRLSRETFVPDGVPVPQSDDHGAPSPFGCPDCGGALWEYGPDGREKFRCRIGHAYSLASLAAAQSDAIDEALWTALRALEEKIELNRRLLHRAQSGSQHPVREKLERRLRVLEKQTGTLRRIVSGVSVRAPRAAIIPG